MIYSKYGPMLPLLLNNTANLNNSNNEVVKYSYVIIVTQIETS